MRLDEVIRGLLLSAGILISTTATEQLHAQQKQTETKAPRTFEQAKKGTGADKLKYLEWLLVDHYKLVYDQKRNPDGIVKNGWFYLPYSKHNTLAQKKIESEARGDGATTPEKQKKYLEAVLEGIKERQITVRCQGHFSRPEFFDAYILIDETVFEGTEDQLKSKLDYQTMWAKTHRDGFLVSGKKLPVDGSPFVWARRRDMAALRSYAEQLKNIIDGTRNIGGTEIENKFLEYYQKCHTELEEWKTGEGKDILLWQAYKMMNEFIQEINSIMESVQKKIVIENGKYILTSK